jgi:DNA-directed RNA polymerase subunit RPC12/RpoP
VLVIHIVDMDFFEFFKKHKCQNCGRRFYKVENYMHHQMLYHSDKNRYDCSNCGLKFPDMDGLKNHVKIYHSYKKNKSQ